MNHELKQFSCDIELAKTAAEQWLEVVATAGRKMQQHSVALSGGRITKTFFFEVVTQSKARSISLSNVHFFWADERCLPPDNPESNFKLANELLFRPLGIAEEKIHRLKGELPPEIAVAHSNSEILQVVPKNSEGLPVLDLIFLGMGEDGHVASLFPHASGDVENNCSPFLFVPDSPKPPPQRISLSYAAIAAAKDVWVLASGKGKEVAFKESLAPNGRTPLAKVLRSRDRTTIFTDIAT